MVCIEPAPPRVCVGDNERPKVRRHAGILPAGYPTEASSVRVVQRPPRLDLGYLSRRGAADEPRSGVVAMDRLLGHGRVGFVRARRLRRAASTLGVGALLVASVVAPSFTSAA